MGIKKQKNIALEGKHGRPVVLDVFHDEGSSPKPVLIFCHGYKGFKDWGVWNLMAEEFARRGFFFIKFNFSFNGGTLEQPVDFPDLDAFGQNTFTRELDDLEVVLDWISSEENPFAGSRDSDKVSLMGHSRGGGTAIIKASEDERIHKLITLASVSDFAARFPQGEEFEAWKEAGIGYVINNRTKQQMPHRFSFYEDFKANEERLTISKAVGSLNKPVLIIHGTEDQTVGIDDAEHLKQWNPEAELLLLEGADHVFGGAHPWEQEELPRDLSLIVEKVNSFAKEYTF